MNWEAIGALGEIVGAIAVVATLLYVAVQAKQTRVAVEHTGGIATAEAHSRARLALAGNPELAAVMAKANSGEELTDGEKMQVSSFCEDRFVAAVIGEWTATPDTPHYESDYLFRFLSRNPAAIGEWRDQHHLTSKLAPELATKVDKWLERNADPEGTKC